MPNRFTRIATVLIILLLAAVLAQPYVERMVFATTVPKPVAPRGDLAEWEKSTVDLFVQAAPSVVQVVSLPAEAARGETTRVSSGTGFVWDAVGHVVTNNHVVENATRIAVRLASDETVEADLVGRAPTYDLAVLRLKRTVSLPPRLAVGSSNDLKVGQAALAIGNPFGLDQSLTSGINGAPQRRLPTSGGREIANVIQTDAAINPGNSGGPLLDSAGRIIGVNTAILSPSGTSAGIGFAIPIDSVNRVVPELIRRGSVPTPGIGIVAASEAAATRAGAQGVVIVRTTPGSSAERAGLRGIDPRSGKVGDVIVGVNGKTVRGLADLIQELERVGVGKNVTLTVQRDGREVPVEVEVTDIGRRG